MKDDERQERINKQVDTCMGGCLGPVLGAFVFGFAAGCTVNVQHGWTGSGFWAIVAVGAVVGAAFGAFIGPKIFRGERY